MTDNPAGVQGYSSPNGRTVLFCADDTLSNAVVATVLTQLGIPFVQGHGCYKGQIEQCFAVDYDLFYQQAYVKIKPYIENQETFMILGYLRAMNWRDADLVWQETGFVEHAGTWHEVTDITGLDGWSWFNGHHFAVEHNPSPDDGSTKERKDAQMIFDLRNELAAVLGARMNREQGQLLHSASELLKGKTLMNGVRIAA